MTRINTNVMALSAYRHLVSTNDRLAVSLERLSSGLKINQAGDDPSGLVSATSLDADTRATDQAIENATRASNIVNTADGAFAQISELLLQIRDEALNAANSTALSEEELDSSQSEVDSAISSINRIAQATSFGGLKLINGSLDFMVNSLNPAASIDRVYMFQGPLSNVTKTLNFAVSRSAERAYIDLSNFATLASDELWEISGNQGSEVFSFVAGTSAAVVRSNINAVRDSTGVAAAVTGGRTFLTSMEFGSDQTAQIVNLGSGTLFSGTQTDNGVDVVGSIEGHTGQGIGEVLRVVTDHLDVEIRFAKPDVDTAANWWATPQANTGSFSVFLKGGAKFQIGPDPVSAQQIRVALSKISSGSLGSDSVGRLAEIVTGGSYDLRTDPDQAVKIVDDAIEFVAKVRGRVGYLDAETLQPMIDVLNVQSENLQAALGDVRDTDFPEEAMNFIRDQILLSVGTQTFSTATIMPSVVLTLLS